MRKGLLLFVLIMSIVFTFSACKEDETDLNNTGEPESIYEYELLEKCSNGTNYLSMQSFEISSSYSIDDIKDNSSGYYVIFEVDTDLTQSYFSNLTTQAELWLSNEFSTALNFLAYNVENKILVYEIPYNEGVDYEELCNLKVTDKKTEFPFVSVFIECFNGYCTVNGNNYAGSCFMLNLE